MFLILASKLDDLSSRHPSDFSVTLHLLCLLSKPFAPSLFFFFQEGSILVTSLAIYNCPYSTHTRIILIFFSLIMPFALLHIFILSLISPFLTLSCNVSLHHLLQHPVSMARNLCLICSEVSHTSAPICYNIFHCCFIYFDFCFGP